MPFVTLAGLFMWQEKKGKERTDNGKAGDPPPSRERTRMKGGLSKAVDVKKTSPAASRKRKRELERLRKGQYHVSARTRGVT